MPLRLIEGTRKHNFPNQLLNRGEANKQERIERRSEEIRRRLQQFRYTPSIEEEVETNG